MSEWRSFISILKGSYFDILVLLSTFFLTVLVDLTIAIEIGVVLSAILFMKRMSDITEKRINNMVDTDLIEDYSKLPEGLGVYEISGPLFFASARKYSEVIEEIGLKSKILIIRMRHVSFIDNTGLQNLKETLNLLKNEHITVVLSGINETVKKDFEAFNINRFVPEEYICDNFEASLVIAKKLLEEA
jgi:SulP family sulfate permease